MLMVMLNDAILLGSMQCSGKMANTTSSKNRYKFDKFTIVVGINFFNFPRELFSTIVVK
jgi:hypothetical protein